MFVIVWKLDLQLLVQSVPITTSVMGSNLAFAEVYSIQHYVIKFGTPGSSTNKTDRHDITEILLKVALNIVNLPPYVILICKKVI